MAVVRGFTSVVKYLLERNADPNLVDNAGETPLITAVQKNEMSSVGLLLKFGADVHKRDANHNTALLIALGKNHAEIVQMLLKEGASVMNITLTGDITIHVAARKCSTWILEMLREKGCDIEKSNRVGSLPLHLAAESGNLEAVKWFLLNGAKHDERDAAGKTAADRAADARQKHVVDWLNDLKVINDLTPSTNQRAEIKAHAEKGRQAHLGSNIGFESFESSPSVQTQDGQRSGTKGGRVEHSTLGDLAKVCGYGHSFVFLKNKEKWELIQLLIIIVKLTIIGRIRII
ncbi:death-associated protein kinase 1-like isoform X1 [Penaeus chinensis]|uniref:death-associated protein kinase 1-like isoform X1 n=1 Tax=Penaeus chinensis TaxID=139456 RepID=UPI001FB6454D|nr:death-associated protein kinase 1-like isoform X1 [Penaeus chinensis]